MQRSRPVIWLLSSRPQDLKLIIPLMSSSTHNRRITQHNLFLRLQINKNLLPFRQPSSACNSHTQVRIQVNQRGNEHFTSSWGFFPFLVRFRLPRNKGRVQSDLALAWARRFACGSDLTDTPMLALINSDEIHYPYNQLYTESLKSAGKEMLFQASKWGS